MRISLEKPRTEKISERFLKVIKLPARESMVSWKKRRQSNRLTSKKPLRIVVVNAERRLKKTRMSKSKTCKSSLRRTLKKKDGKLRNSIILLRMRIKTLVQVTTVIFKKILTNSSKSPLKEPRLSQILTKL